MTAFFLLAALSAATASAADPKAFTYAIVQDVSTLDPHWQYDGVSAFAADQIYEGLVGYDSARADQLSPRLAEKIPSKDNGLLSSDGRTYTFPIRSGVLFHDGSPLTPEDVRYSLLRSILQDRSGGHAWMLLDPILGDPSSRVSGGKPRPDLYERAAAAVTVAGNSVVIRLNAPFAPFLSVLASYGPVVSKKTAIQNGDWDGTPISWMKHNDPPKEAAAFHERGNGTGPFKLERWDRQNKTLLLRRNERYWRAPAKLERLVVKTIDEFGTRRLLLQGGDADAAVVARSYLPQVSSLPGIKVVDGLPMLEVHNSIHFVFDIDPAGNPYIGSGKLDGAGIPSDFFKDKDVRLGFAHAFPYEQYLREVYRGAGTLSRGPIPRGLFAYDPTAPLRSHDPAKAEAHFKKAFGGAVWAKGFKLSCLFAAGVDTRDQACRILGSVLKKINPRFVVETRGVQGSSFLDLYVKRKMPLFCGRWGLDYPDPHNPVFAYFHSQGYYAKSSGYSNPALDALIDKAAAASGPAERIALYKKILRAAHEDAPQMFTVDTHDARVMREGVTDFHHNPISPLGYFWKVGKR